MSKNGLHFVGIGRGLASTWRNATATSWRALLSALADRGHRVTFLEPDDPARAARADLPDPLWARRIVWRDADELERALAVARSADVIVKASGVLEHDGWLDDVALSLRRPGNLVLWWDFGHGGTEALARLGRWDAVATASAVTAPWRRRGAREVISLPPSLDPGCHRPPKEAGEPALVWMGAYCPTGSARVAPWLARTEALVAGDGWQDRLPEGARWVGHVSARAHGELLGGRALLNVNRPARPGWPDAVPPRLIEAAGCGGALITEPFAGLGSLFDPGDEVLVVRSPEELRDTMATLSPERIRALGQAARARALAQHTNDRLVTRLEALVAGVDGAVSRARGAAQR